MNLSQWKSHMIGTQHISDNAKTDVVSYLVTNFRAMFLLSILGN